MKLLVFSDLHGRLSVLNELIQLEASTKYDAILAAGDIGAYGRPRVNVKTVIDKLAVFSCPMLFVLGNSDPEDSLKDVNWPLNGKLITDEPIMLGDYAVLGLNGIYDVYGRTKQNSNYSSEEFRKLSDSIRKYNLNPRRSILLTHERLYHLKESFVAGNPLLYLYGHHHRPNHTLQHQTNFINCSVLDGRSSKWGAGVYWVIEINGEMVAATPKPIGRPTRRGIVFDRRKAKQELRVFNQLYPDLTISISNHGSIKFPI